jgi:two-component system sensor histidine kinase ChiS
MKKILIVDDDTTTLDVVHHILTVRGFNVKTYASGLNVPDVVNSYNPHLILLDIRLPGKSGTEVCIELKQVYKNLPVILFSTHTKEGIAYDECQADAFISKPFDVIDLLANINIHI